MEGVSDPLLAFGYVRWADYIIFDNPGDTCLKQITIKTDADQNGNDFEFVQNDILEVSSFSPPSIYSLDADKNLKLDTTTLKPR